METNPSGILSYTTASNRLSTSFSEMPEYLSMPMIVSDFSTGGGYQDGSYKSDVTINTLYIPNLISLSNSDKKKFIAERKKQGVKSVDGKVSRTINELYKLKKLKRQNFKAKGNIKALKKKLANDNYEGD